MSSSIVRAYYVTQLRQEWLRLARDPYHRLEYETSLHYLEKLLPPAGHILDAGCGPGRYSLELARRRYNLTALDLTPQFLAFARRQAKKAGLLGQISEFREASIADLGIYPANNFDAVICLGGPLSHIVDGLERRKAILELIRVARPGAPIFVSVMSRLSVMVVELMLFQNEIPTGLHRQIRESGDYHGGSGFTACHFFLPEELRHDFDLPQVNIIEMAGLEGLGSNHRLKINQLARDEQSWRAWLETHYQTCTHPSVIGLSEHMLIVVQKRG